MSTPSRASCKNPSHELVERKRAFKEALIRAALELIARKGPAGFTSAATMRANQLRLWFYSMAYVLLCALRRIGLRDTDFANATCGTIRLKLLKIGALVRVSVRRIRIAMASACPAAQDWGRAAIRLAIAAIARASPA